MHTAFKFEPATAGPSNSSSKTTYYQHLASTGVCNINCGRWRKAGLNTALLPSTLARPLISDRESPTHTVGPDGTLSVMVVAGPGARGHWNDGYNVVGAGDSDALGDASSTVGGYLALGALRQKARAMAGDAGRALRTLAAAVADGVGRAMTAVEGLRDGRRGGRVRWRPRFGDG